jgi:anti-sigma-K factor RskA
MTGAEKSDDDRALAGEYVLGVLPPEEARAASARIATDPEFAALVAEWRADLATLADEVEPVAPPARVWRATERRLFGRARRRWWAWAAPVALAAALAAAVVFWPSFAPRAPVPPAAPAYRAELVAQDGDLRLAAAYDAEAGTLFVAREGAAAPDGRALELWIIAGDDAPVSLGVLPDDPATVVVVAPELRAALDGAVLAVSDEPAGGSPTGQPTGAVLATGALTEA